MSGQEGRLPRLTPIPAPTRRLGHAYTVDVYLHGAESKPCIICGQHRTAHDDCYCEDGLTCLPCATERMTR